MLARIVAEDGEVVPVGEPVAWIESAEEELLGDLLLGPATEAGAETVPAVPAARALAAETGLDLAGVPPSGRWGSVRLGDVEAFAAQRAAAVEESSGVPEIDEAIRARPQSPEGELSRREQRRRRIRRRLAETMSASAAVPQFTVFVELDLEPLERVRRELLAGAGWTAILVRAQALALERVPALRGRWDETAARVVPDEGIGLALAVDTPDGLLAPVLRDPHRRPLAEVAARVRELVRAANEGRLAPEELAGGTTVFSNLGGFGVERFTALLTPPHATALSAGSVSRRMRVFEDGSFAPRLQATFGLTVDHRVADGADAARFVGALRSLLADPQLLRG